MTNETTAGVGQGRCVYCGGAGRFQIVSSVADHAWANCFCTRAEHPRPTEGDPILRLFIEEILRQTPNGEAIRVKYHPNGEWSVLPEGKADAGLARYLRAAIRLANINGTDGVSVTLAEAEIVLAALTSGADGVAAEREACAAIAAKWAEQDVSDDQRRMAEDIETDIRARMGDG